jgi:hypothetical protein
MMFEPLPYDTAAYAATLAHIGTPWGIPEWPGALLASAIPGEPERYDLVGPWPYCTPPSAEQLPMLTAALRTQGFVTFRAFFRPDSNPPVSDLQRHGFVVTPLKEHFVFDPRLDMPTHSAKTRYNIRRAQRRWTVDQVSLADHHSLIARYHDTLTQNRPFSAMAALGPMHLSLLGDVPGVNTLAAFDSEGLGAALITLHSRHSVHFHLIAGADRAYQTCAFYALYQAALDRWGQQFTLYLGGAPSAANGPGIARFKRRFANRSAPILMAYTIVDSDAYQRLVCACAAPNPNWFPPYRG